jgi:hypothetical protein
MPLPTNTTTHRVLILVMEEGKRPNPIRRAVIMWWSIQGHLRVTCQLPGYHPAYEDMSERGCSQGKLKVVRVSMTNPSLYPGIQASKLHLVRYILERKTIVRVVYSLPASDWSWLPKPRGHSCHWLLSRILSLHQTVVKPQYTCERHYFRH